MVLERVHVLVLLAVVVLAVALVIGRSTPASVDGAPRSASVKEVQRALSDHTRTFHRKEVLCLQENVYLAIGYGLANSAMIVGTDGVVVVDTMESVEAGREVAQAFAEITDLPIKAIIYTHNHADHVMGAEAFAPPERRDEIEIWSHSSTVKYLTRVLSVTGEITTIRAARQFGNYLNEESGFVNAGIGPRLRNKGDSTNGVIMPTQTFDRRHTLQVAGLELELIHAPGETNDQLVVWYADRRILFGADNFYKSFPNIYAIRGTPSRDAMQWVRSIDLMRTFNASHLVLGHTRPVSGWEEISSLLLAYRDAVQYVHDQTTRLMNQGLYLDEIVQRITLPPTLREHPYLQPFYGTVPWAVRAVFTHYLGWFSGDPSQLRPLAPRTRAKRLASLAGGRSALLGVARTELAADDRPLAEMSDAGTEPLREHAQWALELADAAIALDPSDPEARRLRVAALQRLCLGALQPSATGRNYYLTSALEEQGVSLAVADKQKRWAINSASTLAQIFDIITVRLNPERAAAEGKRSLRVCFEFSDTGEKVCFAIRNCVCVVESGSIGGKALELEKENHDSEVRLECDDSLWRSIVLNERSPSVAYASGALRVLEGSIMDFSHAMSLFDPAT